MRKNSIASLLDLREYISLSADWLIQITVLCRARIDEEKLKEKLDRQVQEADKLKMHKEALEKEFDHNN